MPNHSIQAARCAYAEAEEHLGGYFVIAVASLDEALDWAEKSPASAEGSGDATSAAASYAAALKLHRGGPGRAYLAQRINLLQIQSHHTRNPNQPV